MVGACWACGDKPLMYVDREISGGEVTSQERRGTTQPDHRVLGNVVQCDGARAMIAAHADHEDGSVTGLWTVGRMVSINLETTRTVGLVLRDQQIRPAMETRQPQRHRGQRRTGRRGARPAGQWQADLRPRHHRTIRISARSRTASAPATCRRSTISPAATRSPSASSRRTKRSTRASRSTKR